MKKTVKHAGRTPLEKSATDTRLLFKREDKNPTGSHKDRAAQYQLALAAERSERAVTISSSGNAAIATSYFAAATNIPAIVFVHPDTDLEKLAAISGNTTTVVVSRRAINGAKLLARELHIPNLRPSTNDDAVEGYKSLGDELTEELDESVDAVVLFVTSGATALAVAQVLHEKRPKIQVHIVQGEGNAAIVEPELQTTDESAHNAAAGRLGVRRSRRAKPLLKAIAKTGGKGHVVSIDEVMYARELLDEEGIIVSDESAANVVVARRLADEGLSVCCVISGAPAPSGGRPRHVVQVNDELEALNQVRMLLGAG